MLLNVVNSSSAAVTCARKRLVDWRIGLLFGISMLVAAPFGAMANHLMPARSLIVVFAALTAAAGILMLLGKQPRRRLEGHGRAALGNQRDRNMDAIAIVEVGNGHAAGCFVDGVQLATGTTDRRLWERAARNAAITLAEIGLGES